MDNDALIIVSSKGCKSEGSQTSSTKDDIVDLTDPFVLSSIPITPATTSKKRPQDDLIELDYAFAKSLQEAEQALLVVGQTQPKKKLKTAISQAIDLTWYQPVTPPPESSGSKKTGDPSLLAKGPVYATPVPGFPGTPYSAGSSSQGFPYATPASFPDPYSHAPAPSSKAKSVTPTTGNSAQILAPPHHPDETYNNLVPHQQPAGSSSRRKQPPPTWTPPTLPRIPAPDDIETFDVLPEAPTSHLYIHQKQPAPTKARAKRLKKEMDTLRSSLPETGIYVRTFESRLDLYQIMYIGPEDTPYQDSILMFDLCLPASFPTKPPLMSYRSFNRRLNPNLYACGKVCLSLLGTWQGDKVEKWSAKSTLLQVVMSLQALVLNKFPYENEPGFVGSSKHHNGLQKCFAYNQRVFADAVYSTTKILEDPSQFPSFENVVRSLYLAPPKDDDDGKGKSKSTEVAEPTKMEIDEGDVRPVSNGGIVRTRLLPMFESLLNKTTADPMEMGLIAVGETNKASVRNYLNAMKRFAKIE